MRQFLLPMVLLWAAADTLQADPPVSGAASWYGEEHRGKLMADGQPFDPDKLTAASWSYPLGSKVSVTVAGSTNTVQVVITDRGPSRRLVSKGRIIDLSRAAFERLASLDRGVIPVEIRD